MIHYPTVCRGTEMDIYIWTAVFIAKKVQTGDNGLETDQQYLIQTNCYSREVGTQLQLVLYSIRGRHCRYRMVVGLATAYVSSVTKTVWVGIPLMAGCTPHNIM